MFNFLSAGLTVLGMFTQASGAHAAGNAAMSNAQAQAQADAFKAAQYEQQAGQSIATGQRQAIEQKRQAQLLQSRALAVAAASGAGASDPTVVHLIAQIGGEGAYRAAVAMYDSEEKARQLRLNAAASRYEGDAALLGGEAQKSAYDTSAVSSLLSGAGTLYTRFGMGGPKTQPAAPVTEHSFN